MDTGAAAEGIVRGVSGGILLGIMPPVLLVSVVLVTIGFFVKGLPSRINLVSFALLIIGFGHMAFAPLGLWRSGTKPLIRILPVSATVYVVAASAFLVWPRRKGADGPFIHVENVINEV